MDIISKSLIIHNSHVTIILHILQSKWDHISCIHAVVKQTDHYTGGKCHGLEISDSHKS